MANHSGVINEVVDEFSGSVNRCSNARERLTRLEVLVLADQQRAYCSGTVSLGEDATRLVPVGTVMADVALWKIT